MSYQVNIYYVGCIFSVFTFFYYLMFITFYLTE